MSCLGANMETEVCVFLRVFETESYFFYFFGGGGVGGALIGTDWRGAANAG